MLRHIIRCTAWKSRALCTSSLLTSTDKVLSGIEQVPTCLLAMLDQQESLLDSIDNEIYTFQSPLLHGSVGQHIRHSLDHLRKPLETVVANKEGEKVPSILYDRRERHTIIEIDHLAARAQVKEIRANMKIVGTCWVIDA